MMMQNWIMHTDINTQIGARFSLCIQTEININSQHNCLHIRSQMGVAWETRSLFLFSLISLKCSANATGKWKSPFLL